MIISHYHGDHVIGLVKADNSPAFPNAEILVPANEHNYWMDDGEMSRAAQGRIEGLFKNNRRVFTPKCSSACAPTNWARKWCRALRRSDAGHSFGHTSLVVHPARRRCTCKAT